MVDITLLEVHLPEAQFNAPFASTGESADQEDDAGAAESDEDGGTGGGIVAVLLVTLGLAALAWYLRSGGDEDVDLEEDVPEN